MNEAVMRLVVRHCETLRVEARAVDAALGGGLGCARARAAALSAAHTLKGSSGTLGFSEVSEAAQALETALRALGARAPAAREAEAVSRAHAGLSAAVAGIAPDRSSLYARMAR